MRGAPLKGNKPSRDTVSLIEREKKARARNQKILRSLALALVILTFATTMFLFGYFAH